jgi:hypothetical protein
MELNETVSRFQAMISETEIGSHYSPAIGKDEGSDLLIYQGEDNKIQINIRLRNPFKSKILAYRIEEIEYRIFLEDDMFFLLLKTSNYNWVAIPFEPRLFDKFDMVRNEEYYFSLILTNVPAGTVLCVRPEIFHMPFSNLLDTIIMVLNEKRESFSAEEYHHKLDKIREIPVEEMAKRALYSCKSYQ